MAERTLDILIRAQDEATRTLQNVGRAGVQAGEQLQSGLGGAFTTVAETGSAAAKDVQFAWERVNLGGSLGTEGAFAPAAAAGVASANEVEAAWKAAGVSTAASAEETAAAVTASAEKEATAQVAASQKAGGAFSGLKGSLVGIAGTAGIAAFGIKSLIDEASQAQQVAAQTAAVIQSTGGAAGVSADHVADLATQLSGIAAVDDEVIAQGENVLLTFTNVRNEVGKGNDIFDQAASAALDLSSAMGTDMQSAVVQLGKALNDPIKGITALTRVGVSFTQQQKDQIAALVESGKTLEAQKVILGEVQKEFGGAAKANATAGEQLKVTFGNIEEALGTGLMPLLGDAADVLGHLSPVIGFAADHASTLLAAFLGYKALLFLPTLLQGVGLAAARLNLNGIASTATTASEKLSGMSKAGALLASGAFAIGIPLVVEAFNAIGEKAKIAAQNTEAFFGILQQGTSRGAIIAGLGPIIDEIASKTGGLTTKEEIRRDLLKQLDAAQHQAAVSGKADALATDAQGKAADTAAAKTERLQEAAQAHADAVENQAFELAKVQPLLKSTNSFFGQQITSLADLKSSWNDWKTQTAGALDFVGGSFDTLAQKEGESVSQLQAGLDKSLASMKTFGANLKTIAQDGGKGAEELVQHLLALGPVGATMAQKLVDAGKEGRRGIEGDLGGALKLAKTESQQLEKTLVGGFHQIARAIIIVTTPVDKLAAKLAAFDGKTYTANVDIITHYEQIGSPSPGTPAGIHAPQIGAAMGYHGMVNEPTWIHVAEGGKAERVDIGPAGSYSGDSGGGTKLAVDINLDRRRFLQAQDLELRFGGPA